MAVGHFTHRRGQMKPHLPNMLDVARVRQKREALIYSHPIEIGDPRCLLFSVSPHRFIYSHNTQGSEGKCYWNL